MKSLRLKGEVVGAPCCYGLGGDRQYLVSSNFWIIFPLKVVKIIEGEFQTDQESIIMVSYKSKAPIYVQKGDMVEMEGKLREKKLKINKGKVQFLFASHVYNETFNYQNI